jgi:4,5-DOPA dioxygenase extradiol
MHSVNLLYMQRRDFLSHSLLGISTMSTLSSFMHSLDKMTPTDEMMPALFIGHGSPMNAIEQNDYNRSWAELGKKLPRPKAILTISAHWLTRDTRVTAMERPQTIHDFGGFPQALFDAQYPAPGSPDFAELTKKIVTKTSIQSDHDWGLDHGTWSFLLPMYPHADIPVYQLSLDYYKPLQYHYELALELQELRKKGVMIIGSGNIVHNLRLLSFSGQTYDWASEFDEKIKSFLLDKNHEGIIHYEKLGTAARMSVPTPDHYLPLIYSIAQQGKNEMISFFNEKTDMGSVSMRSFVIR